MHSPSDIKRIHARFPRMSDEKFKVITRTAMEQVGLFDVMKIKQHWWLQELRDWGFTDIEITDNPLIKRCCKGNINFRVVLSQTGRSLKIIKED